VIGGFPNYFMEMDLSQAGDFLRGLRDVRSLADWNSLRDRYGILRNDARLWATYDCHPRECAASWHRGRLSRPSYYDLFDSVY
jgi:hypothetical protein